MRLNWPLTAAVATLAIGAQSQSAHATNILVATIDGGYDLNNGGGVDGIYTYDTPWVEIINSTNYDFTDVSIAMKGYQPGTENYGVTETVNLGTVGANTQDYVIWGEGATNGAPVPTGGPTAGQLFTYDYDDSYPGNLSPAQAPACGAEGYTYCSYVGNFSVTLTGTWNNPAYGAGGTEIASVFSPSSNATGGFIGFEGLDPSGLSETTYDDHSGTPHGTLANIYVGSPTTIPGAPEPSTWALMLIGFGGLGLAFRVRRRAHQSLAPA